jgi:hypothetical protein
LVEAAARELADLRTEEFAARIKFESMSEHEIYPQIWDRDADAEQLVEFVAAGYDVLREHFIEASATGQGFVISHL